MILFNWTETLMHMAKIVEQTMKEHRMNNITALYYEN